MRSRVDADSQCTRLGCRAEIDYRHYTTAGATRVKVMPLKYQNHLMRTSPNAHMCRRPRRDGAPRGGERPPCLPMGAHARRPRARAAHGGGGGPAAPAQCRRRLRPRRWARGPPASAERGVGREAEGGSWVQGMEEANFGFLIAHRTMMSTVLPVPYGTFTCGTNGGDGARVTCAVDTPHSPLAVMVSPRTGRFTRGGMRFPEQPQARSSARCVRRWNRSVRSRW